MLREMKDVRQIPGDPPRRWFSDERFDLIVWFDPSGGMYGFQLCYDLKSKPRALTWLRDKGYRHDGIDGGEDRPGLHKSSPILVTDGSFNAAGVGDELERAGAALPPEIISPILAKVRQYGR
ncbi:MAG TPA: hypothetical protein PL037_04985 [Elusimicrobiales bacterium]|nr:hypothetical protein [Elusimicrobiales bacterium]